MIFKLSPHTRSVLSANLNEEKLAFNSFYVCNKFSLIWQDFVLGFLEYWSTSPNFWYSNLNIQIESFSFPTLNTKRSSEFQQQKNP